MNTIEQQLARTTALPSSAAIAPNYQRLFEAVVDIAYVAGTHRYYSGDSRDDTFTFIKWGAEFEKLRQVDAEGNETYNGKDYMTAVEEFAESKLEL